MPPLPSLSKEFNDMVGKSFSEAAFRSEAQKSGYVSRVIRPGDRVTKEFRANRVNAHLDQNNKIARINFG